MKRILLIICLCLLNAASLFAGQIPSDTVVTLERTACYGVCPIYKVALLADGTVIFEGQRNVKISGTVKSRITQAQMEELAEEFEKIGYFELDNEYTFGNKACLKFLTAAPSAITSITMNRKSKIVKHHYVVGAQKSLKISQD